DAQIRAQLELHLCRCGTHMRILRAIHRAAELIQGGRAAISTPTAASGPADGGETGNPSSPGEGQTGDSHDPLRRERDLSRHPQARERPER
ncbi:MAG TPA: hypothetical protein VFB37_01700, partial [Steroidobacteraceae bacterium]|nr:hypothetical protein [Steroidobacteraceae bacterium]